MLMGPEQSFNSRSQLRVSRAGSVKEGDFCLRRCLPQGGGEYRFFVWHGSLFRGFRIDQCEKNIRFLSSKGQNLEKSHACGRSIVVGRHFLLQPGAGVSPVAIGGWPSKVRDVG